MALTILAAALLVQAVPPPPAVVKDDKSKMVCTAEQPTGSRMRKKKCMTQAQREALANAHQTAHQEALAAPKPGTIGNGQ